MGGSADVVSGYYDHCVNLAAKNKSDECRSSSTTTVPGFVLVVSPRADH